MLARVVRDTAVACVVLAVGFALWKGALWDGVAVVVGGLLIALSFWAIRGTVDTLIGLRSGGETAPDKAGFQLVKFFTRHGMLALASYGMMMGLHLDPVGLLVGVSSLGVAVAVEALRDVRWRRFL